MRPQHPSQIFDEFAKIDPVFGQIIKDDAFASMDDFDIDQIHLQPALGDELLAEGKSRRPVGREFGVLLPIILIGQPEDFALRGIGQKPRIPF